jgi:5-methylcytosine-specific restriction endonuclease McrA
MPLKYAKPESRAAEKKQTKAERLARQRIVYRLVSKRDKVCRCCKASGPGLHHHHLKFRSAGGQDTEANLFLACPICHADLHAYRLTVVGDDARYTLRFVRVK